MTVIQEPAPWAAAAADSGLARDLIMGRDALPGIVSVAVGNDGTVRLWRRVRSSQSGPDRVVMETDRFLPWFLATSPDVLAPLGARLQPAQPGMPYPEGALAAYRELAGPNPYRYTVYTRSMAEVTRLLTEGYNQRHGARISSLREMRGEAHVRPLVEQYLTSSGRTYFKGMAYDDVHRLQFDLETTDLDPQRGEIFMISLRDNRGLELVLDTDTFADEADLLRGFVTLLRDRDPDVLENHNIFGFDIPFLVARAAVHGVPLTLGRDAGEFSSHPDSLKVGALSEGFTRYTLSGREIIDTLHAVKRYDAVARDMRRHGLKHAARYFGLNKEDREYVEGPEIAAVFRHDPQRIRRYALDDVAEVDGLSRKLLGATFMLASMVPKSYERIATSGTGQGLIEPLLVRAYVTAGQSVPAGDTGQPYEGGATALFASGMLSHVVKADIASLYPSIMRVYRITARSDAAMNAILTLLDYLMDERLRHKALARGLAHDDPQRSYHDALQGAIKILINSFYGSLGNPINLFADIEAASRITAKGREILFQMLHLFEQRGVRLIEADTDGVYFSVPGEWAVEQELDLVRQVSDTLPPGITIEHDGRWRTMYSYMEKNYALLGYDGSLLVKGASFRSSRSEFYGERFFRAVLPLIMEGRMVEARGLYLDTIARLRAHEVPVEEVCVNMQLTKSAETYRQSKRKEEAYEVMLAAGRAWQPGQRISYYQATRGRKKLLQEAASDYDAEAYVAKLSDTFAQRLARAVSAEAFASLFSEQPSLFALPLDAITPVVTEQHTLAQVWRALSAAAEDERATPVATEAGQQR